MLCTKTANTNGMLATQMGEVIIPYDANKIARDTKYFSIDTIIVALELYKKLGLIYESNDGNLMISNYSEMVGSETSSAIKKREYRQKLKEKEQGQSERQCLGQLEDNVRQEKEIRDKSIEFRYKSKEKDKKETLRFHLGRLYRQRKFKKIFARLCRNAKQDERIYYKGIKAKPK